MMSIEADTPCALVTGAGRGLGRAIAEVFHAQGYFVVATDYDPALLKDLAGEPRYLPTVVSDKTTALTVAYAVAAALFHRERHGEGQAIEVPMFETMTAYVMAEHLYGRTFEPAVGTAGYERLMSEHRRPYKTRDGYIAILPYMNNHWLSFCELAGRGDLLEDERFLSLASRNPRRRLWIHQGSL